LPLNVESLMLAMPPWTLIAPPPVVLFWKRHCVWELAQVKAGEHGIA